jgi:hypothetical protein
MNHMFHRLLACLLAVMATVLAYNSCPPMGGQNCQDIVTLCADHSHGTIIDVFSCCGTQEIPGSCCQFVCNKKRCADGSIICSRLWTSTTPSTPCASGRCNGI